MNRNRIAYALVTAAVIIVGLFSRSAWAAHLPTFVAAYAGDTLWALTVFLTLGFTFPRSSTLILAVAAIGIAFTVEFGQLYQAEWLNQLRQTLPGKLLLGSGFLWSDFACYTVGVLLGAGTEWFGRLGHRLPEK